MKKLLSLVFISLFIFSCEDDGKTVEVPSHVYLGTELVLNITGLNNNTLTNQSVVISNNGVTVALNNIIDPTSSVVISGSSVSDFGYKTTVARYVSDIKGAVSNGVLTLTGTLTYTAAGVAKTYSGNNLSVNGAAAAKGTSAKVTYTQTDKIVIDLTKLVTGSADDTKAFSVEGTIVDNGDGTFTLTASGSDKKIKVDVDATFVEGLLSISIQKEDIPATPPV